MLNPRLFFFVFGILTLFTTVSCSSTRKTDPLAYQGPPHIAPKKEINALPPSLVQNMKPLIILDAGHGGSDEGAKVRSLLEKRITLTTTLLTKKYLEELGFRVLLTRSRDVFVSLQRRTGIANKAKASLFVSIHYNSSRNNEASGIEIFYSDDKDWRSHSSKRLANLILYHLVDETGALSRGVKKGNFHVIRETEMPAVLVEGGFMTNQEEGSLLKDRTYLDHIAKGIAEGVEKFLK
jgi:N-acetylmuramoyl-L-alanine amidase